MRCVPFYTAEMIRKRCLFKPNCCTSRNYYNFILFLFRIHGQKMEISTTTKDFVFVEYTTWKCLWNLVMMMLVHSLIHLLQIIIIICSRRESVGYFTVIRITQMADTMSVYVTTHNLYKLYLYKSLLNKVFGLFIWFGPRRQIYLLKCSFIHKVLLPRQNYSLLNNCISLKFSLLHFMSGCKWNWCAANAK